MTTKVRNLSTYVLCVVLISVAIIIIILIRLVLILARCASRNKLAQVLKVYLMLVSLLLLLTLKVYLTNKPPSPSFKMIQSV